jgi:hypothetical protein
VSDVDRALEHIAEIRERLATGQVYRGWRSVPVASSGAIGLAAAAWQSALDRPIEPRAFMTYWVGIAVAALLVGCCEIAWHYAFRATAAERARTRRVLGQFLPALVAGALVTGALFRQGPALVGLLPGLWALFFGVGIISARPYLPGASTWVALFYWSAGLALVWRVPGADRLSPWSVGGTFGAGQILAALVLYVSVERPARRMASGADGSGDTEVDVVDGEDAGTRGSDR